MYRNPLIRAAILTKKPPAGGSGYDPDAQAYFAAMSVQESDAWKLAHSNFIAGLKTDGLWAGLDWLLFFWASSEQAAFLNARHPVKSGTKNGTITHSAGHYMAGDGSTGYLVLEAQGAGGQAQQDDCGGGIDLMNENAGVAGAYFIVGATTNATLKIGVARTTGNGQFRCGDGSNSNGLGAHNPKTGTWSVHRKNSTEKNPYFNDALQNSGAPVTLNSTALGSNAVWIWRDASSYASDGLGMFWMGKGWNATQLAAFNARKATLKAAISA